MTYRAEKGASTSAGSVRSPLADGTNVSVVPSRVARRRRHGLLRRFSAGCGRGLIVPVALALCWLPASLVHRVASFRSIPHASKATQNFNVPLPLDTKVVLAPVTEGWSEEPCGASAPSRPRDRVTTDGRPLRRGFLEGGDSGDIVKRSAKHRSRRPVETPRRACGVTRPGDRRAQTTKRETLRLLTSTGPIAARAPPALVSLCPQLCSNQRILPFPSPSARSGRAPDPSHTISDPGEPNLTLAVNHLGTLTGTGSCVRGGGVLGALGQGAIPRSVVRKGAQTCSCD